MSSGIAPICVSLEESNGSSSVAISALLAAMLGAREQISDLIFSPGRVPQLQSRGELIPIQAPAIRPLTADDTRRIASELIGTNKQAISTLREQGSCDVSYALPGVARFRVSVFIQRGSCAVVMRVIPTVVPDVASLGLPTQVQEVARLRDGLVLVTGPRNSGKSSTLAALLDDINRDRVCHIVTLEDPIEFLHNHRRATVHQRELHSDMPSFPLGLRAAMRQAPDVILVSELRERDTVELAIEAVESGHLLFSSLNAQDATQAMERMVRFFSAAEQEGIRRRLARSVRCVISQQLLPRKNGNGRVAVAKLLTIDSQTRKQLEQNDFQELPAKEANSLDDLDAGITELARAGVIDLDTALLHARDPERIRLVIENRPAK